MNRPREPQKTEGDVVVESGAPTTPGTAPASPAAEAERKMAEQLAQLQAEKEDLLKTLVRRQADFENYRKRVERERKEDRDRITAALVEGLLPVLDGFERALAAHQDPAYDEYRKGFELIYGQLQEFLARNHIARMETLGRPFDPHYHHAVETVESEEHPDGTVIEELQAGYKIRDRVVRPAMVRVATRPERKSVDADRGRIH